MPKEPHDLPTKPLDGALRVAPVAAKRVRVVVEGGPDDGSNCAIEPDHPHPILVGQSAACDLRLRDASVSRRHLALELRDGELVARDLGSTNGTYIQGVSIVEVKLTGGERARIGSSVLRFDFESAPKIQPLSNAKSFGRMLGQSPAMRRLHPLCRKLAMSDVPVVIEGETGTGKEVLAEALHELGPRASGPFVVFDCTTVSSNLIESALFGHEKGSFTGALEQRKGVFELADGGTLLIDEIGDLDLELQAKLLRAIERKRVQRVGGRSWIEVDARILSSTRRDLDRAVQEGRFRDDLFFRLAVTRVELPPLRRREGDAELLAHAFWSRLAPGASPPADFLRRLGSYDWPGNVRELHNAVARRVALGDWIDEAEAETDAMPAPADVVKGQAALSVPIDLRVPFPMSRRRVVEAFEKAYLSALLLKFDGNVARAAEASGVARRYFRILRARYRDSTTVE